MSYINKENVEDVFPLSDIQMGMILESMLPESPAVYFNQTLIPFSIKDFDKALFDRALNLMVEKHAMLRTIFDLYTYDQPIQYVCKKIEPDIEHFDYSNFKSNEQLKNIEKIFQDDKDSFFNIKDYKPLWRVKIFKINANDNIILWTDHHAIQDGWSFALLITELNNTYEQLKKNKAYIPVKLKSSYKDFIAQQIAVKRNKKIIKFWENELEGLGMSQNHIFKNFDEKDYSNISARKQQIRKTIDISIYRGIKELSIKTNVSIKNLCCAAYLYAFNMFSADNDVTVGLLTHNRPEIEDAEKIVGCFLNEIPCRVKIAPKKKWIDYIKFINEKVIELSEYSKLTYFEISQLAKQNRKSKRRLFDTLFYFLNFHVVKSLDTSSFIEGEENNDLQINDKKTFVESDSLIDFIVDETKEFNANIIYSEEIVEKKDIERLYEYFLKVLTEFITNPNEIAKKEKILSKEERQRYLVDYNSTATFYNKDICIHKQITEVAKKFESKIALRQHDKSLTYAELENRSNQLANTLIQKGVKKNEIIGLMCGRDFEMIIGILGILKAGAVYLPLDFNYPENRIKYMLDDCQVELVLVSSNIKDELSDNFREKIDVFSIDYIDESNETVDIKSNSSDIAYIIYTSGSTGKPKGVTIQHCSVLNFAKGMMKVIDFQETKKIITLTTIAFDIFVLETLVPLMIGMEVVIANENTQRNFNSFSKLMLKECVQMLQITPSRLKLLKKDMKGFKMFKFLHEIMIGGEAFPNELTSELQENDGLKIYNMYGPTETTVWSIVKSINEKSDINIGSPISNTQVYILDKNLDLLPNNIIGELYISGDGLSEGYINNQEQSHKTFILNPFLKDNKMYRTGDLAKWLPSGEIEFIGRVDTQVKLQGYRIELGEIEQSLLKIKTIKQAAVLVIDNNEEEYLTAFIVVDGSIEEKKIRSALLDYLPYYMIPKQYIIMESLPQTPNGKVDRKALSLHEITPLDDFVAPSTELEKKLIEVWSEVLNLAKDKISVTSNFFALGGHSLNALLVINKVEKLMSVRIPLSIFFSDSSIKEISYYIDKQQKSSRKEIQIVEKKDFYPITSIQSRFYIFQKMEPNSTSFNVPGLIPITKEIPFEKILKWLNKIIERHEAFRTAFIQKNNNIYQKIYDEVNIDIERYEIEQSERESIIAKFQRPFDLSKAPILRIGHVFLDDNSEFIMYDSHHIISDRITNDILRNDFNILGENKVINPLKIQYKDYSEWQNSKEQKNKIQDQKEYWLNIFNKDWAPINLPTDFNRPEVLTNEDGTTVGTVYNRSNVEKIRILTQHNNISVFMFFHTVINIFLNKITGQNDFSIGTYTFGRNMPDLENIVGVFVNHVVVRNKFQIDFNFNTFLKKTSEKIIEAFENQEYPYEVLVDDLKLKRQSNHNPIFDIAVNYQEFNYEISEMEEKSILIHKKGGGGVDLNFQILDFGEKIILAIAYCDKLFMPDTIDRYILYVNTIVDSVLNNPNVKISEIKIIDSPQMNIEPRSNVEFEL